MKPARPGTPLGEAELAFLTTIEELQQFKLRDEVIMAAMIKLLLFQAGNTPGAQAYKLLRRAAESFSDEADAMEGKNAIPFEEAMMTAAKRRVKKARKIKARR